MMCEKGFPVINYIDNYISIGVPNVAWASYEALLQLMAQLGFTVSDKKLVSPSICVTCLGVMIDTVTGTIAIPPEKVNAINDVVRHWLDKDITSKCQLQSILGLLLYVQKCLRPAMIFLTECWNSSDLLMGVKKRPQMVCKVFANLQWCVTV